VCSLSATALPLSYTPALSEALISVMADSSFPRLPFSLIAYVSSPSVSLPYFFLCFFLELLWFGHHNQTVVLFLFHFSSGAMLGNNWELL
jgi:hypothetical protein